MIQKLRISNFALIENLELDLNKGFTVLTGETGSGKSILLNAFSLLLGDRAHSSLVGAYGKKAIVEAQLDVRSSDKLFFDAHNLDFEATTLVRREIVKDGKSRAFINDSPVSLAVLKTFAIQKLMVHSQYNTFELKSKQKQLELYDLLSGNESSAKAFSMRYEEYIANVEKLNSFKKALQKEDQDREYNLFLKEEIESLKLYELNYEDLEAELFKLENADAIKSVLGEVNQFTDEGAVYSKIKQYIFRLEKLGTKDKSLIDLLERLRSIEDDISLVSSEASYYLDEIESEPGRLTYVVQQWDEYNRILLKHGFSSQPELITFYQGLENKKQDHDALQQTIKKLQNEQEVFYLELMSSAETLHESRIKAKKRITKGLTQELSQLKLPDTKLDFQIEKTSIKHSGISNVSIIFSANKGYGMIEIENAASGGELSRLMLALLKRISEEKKMPTILFDEIDSGVSGDVADKIGVLLHKMGQDTQLLVISHLPQVASKASAHFVVEKKQGKERTQTYVRMLSKEERIYETARLMSGESITKAALETAKNLMN